MAGSRHTWSLAAAFLLCLENVFGLKRHLDTGRSSLLLMVAISDPIVEDNAI